MKEEKTANRNISHYEETVTEINGSLEKIEQAYDVFTPHLKWFEEQVLLQQRMVKKKYKRDFYLFSFISLFILSILMITLYQVPVFFGLIQMIFGIGISLCYLAHYLKQRVTKT
ncbi:YxlC family protein [Peribacillus tepidiphilus]|uniref:YxlC family protein n=1 Tax=Peribacillus tepidiphilus TaxID=2652445 RepID=UPI001291A69D|nr:YxlC family protein [Peribacillus tepidiphilus]